VGAYNLCTNLAYALQLAMLHALKLGAMTVPSCPPQP
jgi:hypothetical protein